MKKSCVAAMAAIAAAIYLAAGSRVARAQTNHANDIFTVVSRSDGRRVYVNLEARGNHCWATASEDRSVQISIGDDLCTMGYEGANIDAAMVARVAPSKISFHLSGKAYVISDAAMVQKTRGLFDPLIQIDEHQQDLGAKQRALGRQQRDLGRQQREVKVKVPDMSADIEKVEADAKRLSTQGGTQSDLGDLQSELGELQSRLGDLQSEAGEQQSKFGDQQSELGDQQSTLGDQQSALGDKSQQLAGEIARNVKDMLQQAVKDGSAKPE